jgi:hypothetical protein
MLSPSGNVSVRVLDSSGLPVTSLSELSSIFNKEVIADSDGNIDLSSNLVVNGGKNIMSRLIAGHNNGSGQKYIKFMSFGSGGHQISDPLVPLVPDYLDEELASEYESIGKKGVSYAFPSDESNSVIFTCLLNISEGNGLPFSEVGLWNEDGTMFARKTFGLITKTDTISLEFNWKITF